MEDFGCPPTFPEEEEEEDEKEVDKEPIIKDKSKGKKVTVTHPKCLLGSKGS